MDFMPALNDLASVNGVINLLTLSILEVVLGIDNIIFVSIIAARLPKEDQKKAWNIGLIAAMALRIGLLFFLGLILAMKEPWITVFGLEMTGKDIILLAGGIFLLVKTTSEIHEKMEGEADDEEDEAEGKKKKKQGNAFSQVLLQIILVDIVFSFDSILTAVGISQNIAIMIFAVIISTIIMMLFSQKVSDFINRHPTVKMLALAFLMMIGFMLILDAVHVEVPKAYVYCSMLFAFLVELLNMRVRRKSAKKAASKRKDNVQ